MSSHIAQRVTILFSGYYTFDIQRKEISHFLYHDILTIVHIRSDESLCDIDKRV